MVGLGSDLRLLRTSKLIVEDFLGGVVRVKVAVDWLHSFLRL